MITIAIRRNIAIVEQDGTEILTMLGTNVEQVAKRLVALGYRDETVRPPGGTANNKWLH